MRQARPTVIVVRGTPTPYARLPRPDVALPGPAPLRQAQRAPPGPALRPAGWETSAAAPRPAVLAVPSCAIRDSCTPRRALAVPYRRYRLCSAGPSTLSRCLGQLWPQSAKHRRTFCAARSEGERRGPHRGGGVYVCIATLSRPTGRSTLRVSQPRSRSVSASPSPSPFCPDTSKRRGGARSRLDPPPRYGRAVTFPFRASAGWRGLAQ